MILADSSVWVRHLRQSDAALAALLAAGEVLCHPLVVGEVAVGNLRNRAGVLGDIAALPQAVEATHAEALDLLERHRLYGLGVGYVDVHLLASTLLTLRATLWTLDARLERAASQLGVAAPYP